MERLNGGDLGGDNTGGRLTTLLLARKTAQKDPFSVLVPAASMQAMIRRKLRIRHLIALILFVYHHDERKIQKCSSSKR